MPSFWNTTKSNSLFFFYGPPARKRWLCGCYSCWLDTSGSPLICSRCSVIYEMCSEESDVAQIRHWGILFLRRDTQGIKGVLSQSLKKKGLSSLSCRHCTWHHIAAFIEDKTGLERCLCLYLLLSRLWVAAQTKACNIQLNKKKCHLEGGVLKFFNYIYI